MPTLFNSVYYALKPIIPWGARTAARRWLAARRRIRCADLWPIDPAAGAPPPGWPGWPGGKKFALVLTHDVEDKIGLSRVTRLMEVERKLGFRSSFNFVPEGPYRVPDSIRIQLDEAGFEVGVHGLIHDGKLFSSRQTFAARAARIRDYVRLWGCSGFRSPLMHHNLAWMHMMGTAYDASTFDTDPFEPEPDGVRTIFPFWVTAPAGGGYVELPYTLVQDFNLFVILQEKNVEIWKKKLDWIAERGGMALLNTHPDYFSFEGTPARNEAPIALYEELLTYAREKYEGACWQALPREVAAFYVSALPPGARNSRRKICLLTLNGYTENGPARRQAEALAGRGDLVDVITTAGPDDSPGQQPSNGVSVFRLPSTGGPIGFLLAAARLLSRRHLTVRYDLASVVGGPSWLVFAAWRLKKAGVKVLFDPLLSAARPPRPGIERKAYQFADHILAPAGTAGPARVQQPRALNGAVRIIAPVEASNRRGVEVIIESLAHLTRRFPHVQLDFYGEFNGLGQEEALARLIGSLPPECRVRFHGDLPPDAAPGFFASADVCVMPENGHSAPDALRRSRLWDLFSHNVPVVFSRPLQAVPFAEEAAVRSCPAGDSLALADAIGELAGNIALRQSLVDAGCSFLVRQNPAGLDRAFLALADSLMTDDFCQS